VVLSLLGVTALTTLSQRWNTYVWLAGVVVDIDSAAVAVRVVSLLLLDFP
jgi:hypothetical protein